PTTGPMPSPMIRMITTSGRPRNTSVYTLAGQRSQRDREMPATARPMPRTSPMMLALTVRIRVFGSPVLNRSGMACLYKFQSRKASLSWDSVDFGALPVASDGAWLAAIAAKSGSCGGGTAFEPGFQPGGSARGTQSEYSFAHVP